MSDQNEQRPPRTVDERIDALTLDRELQAGMLRDLDTNILQLIEQVKAVTANQGKANERLDRLQAITENTALTVQQLAATVEQLAGIAAKHEKKIGALKQRPGPPQ